MHSVFEFLTAYYPQLVFVHVLSVMIWLWSAAIAYTSFVSTAWKEWRKDPTNELLRERRNWVFYHYEKGLILEHGAMVVTLITGPLLVWLSGMDYMSIKWLLMKALIAFAVLLPLEIIDSWLAHFGGNKRGLKAQGVSDEKFERYMRINWSFLTLSAPVAVAAILITVYLAVVKPT